MTAGYAWVVCTLISTVRMVPVVRHLLRVIVRARHHLGAGGAPQVVTPGAFAFVSSYPNDANHRLTTRGK